MIEKPLGQVRNYVLKIAGELRGRKITGLRPLVASPVHEQLQVAGVAFDVSTWAREHGHDKLAVIVDASRRRFFGMYCQMTADGFYIDSAGVVSNFAEEDYWEHGY